MRGYLIQFPEELIVQIDGARADTPRAAWIRRACENRLNGSRTKGVEGSPAPAAIGPEVSEVVPPGEVPAVLAKSPPDSPKKPRACAHSETIFKMGARCCVKCGEFV